jgi:hypothetical protein
MAAMTFSSAALTSTVALRAPARRSATVRGARVAVKASMDEAMPAPEAPAPKPSMKESVMNTMSFGGWAPELINGRVAQIAFVAGAAAEAVTGETLPAQAHDHVFSLAFVSSLIALASFMPNVQGEKYTSEPESKGAFGPFSPGKELLHGRLAMVGLAAWIAIESHTGVAFFHR